MTPKETKTVLVHEWVTGGGLAGDTLPASWAAEGRAMRRAIAHDFARVPGVRVLMTLDARLSEEPGPWTTVHLGPGEEIRRLEDLAQHSDFTLIIAPESRGVLEERATLLENLGVRSLGSTPAAIALTGDKLRFHEFLSQKNFPTPKTQRLVPSQGLPADFPYPAVLKPIDGAGSLDTFLIPDLAEISGDVLAHPDLLIQEFATGIPMSASFLVANCKAEPIAVGRQNVVLQEGRFFYEGGWLPHQPMQIDGAIQSLVETVEGLAGFVGVDYVWNERLHQAMILELNPRPTTSLVGLTRQLPPGVLAAAWMETVLGQRNVEGSELASRVHSQRSCYFRADGTILDEREGGDS